MYYNFDKQEVKEILTEDQIFELLEEWDALPERRKDCIVCRTICHNPRGEGSHKLYYYYNTRLFQCYSGCSDPLFDIFELTQKVFHNQQDIDIDLNEAVRFISMRFGIEGKADANKDQEDEDWKIFGDYMARAGLTIKDYNAQLPEYDDAILKRFNYNVKIAPWLKEGITQEVLDYAKISFYPGGDQIVIPHFDIDGRLVGIRGRTVVQEDADRFGKYRPIYANHTSFSHPLGFNLYGINWAKDNIRDSGKAIIFEGEKSVLLYMSYFGIENNIAVAACGSNITLYQFQLLKNLGVKEVIIAFDRQFEKIGTEEQQLWGKKLLAINSKLKNDVLVSFIYDKDMITGYKDSPIDCGSEKFLTLFKNRKYIKDTKI